MSRGDHALMLRAVPPELLTYGELGEALGVSVRTLRKWKATGMPCVPLGDRLLRFRLAECLAWLEAYEKRSAA